MHKPSSPADGESPTSHPSRARVEPRWEPASGAQSNASETDTAGNGWRGAVAARATLLQRAARRTWPAWTLLAAVLLGALLYVLRQPLSDRLWPQNRAQQLRQEASLALARGQLTATDGHGARELFEAALALDPDRSDTRAGLAKVGQAALTQARQALATHRYADAHRGVALARELGVPTAQVEAVAAAVRHREAAEAGIDHLLQQAAAARAAGRLDGDEHSALWLYQRVLTLQPSHTLALEGREDTLSDLLQQAQQALASGELATAAGIVQRAKAGDPGHAALPGVLAQLAQASERRRQRAYADLRGERLPSALAGYRAVVAVDPGDGEAVRGLEHVATAYALRAERLAADFRFAAADAALRQAQAIAPDLPAIAHARQHVARARQRQPRYAGSLTVAERQRRLRQLLQQAAAAEAQGDLLLPPGESAYDSLRAARAIAPADARVRTALARLLPAAKACFETELRGNRLNRASACLDARRVLEGDSTALSQAQQRLAQRWIAVGNERLGAGEMQAAQAALASARALDAGATGLDEFAQRLRAAAAAD